MRIGKKSSKREKKAMSVSLYANLMFVVVELVMAIVTGSQAVLLDGVYDGIEFVMLLPSIFLIPLLYKPSNEKYPFGHMQMETVFIVVKGITMITVTVGLITNSINILFHGGRPVDFGVVAWFELFACVLGIIVTFYLKRKNKAMNSPLITVEMQGWKMDSMLSLGMTAVFFLPVFLPFKGVGQLTPYLDPFITIVLLISPEEETVSEIKQTVEPIIQESNCVDIYYDIVRTGRKLWISAYIKLNKDELSVRKFKMLQTRCIAALSEKYTDFYFELLPEIELDMEELEELQEKQEKQQMENKNGREDK